MPDYPNQPQYQPPRGALGKQGRVNLIQNDSSLPAVLLLPVLQRAAVSQSVKGPVAVRVLRNGTVEHGYLGLATPCPFARAVKGHAVGEWTHTNGGVIDLPNPLRLAKADGLAAALEFHRVAVHEFKHVKDYQLGKGDQMKAAKQKHRWSNRHHEKMAMRAEKRAADEVDPKRDDAILALALVFEEAHRGSCAQ